MKKDGHLNFFIGIAIGIVSAFILGAMMVYFQWCPTTQGLNRVISFGNCKLRIQKTPEPILKEFEDVHFRELWMTLDDKPFLLITHNKEGKVSGLHLLKMRKDDKYPILSLAPSKDNLGKWENAVYSNRNESGKLIGDIYQDMDFDGQFDFRVNINKERTKTKYIFFNGEWISVLSSSNPQSAKTEEKSYVFEYYMGWQEK